MSRKLSKKKSCSSKTGRTCPGGRWSIDCRCIKKATNTKRKSKKRAAGPKRSKKSKESLSETLSESLSLADEEFIHDSSAKVSKSDRCLVESGGFRCSKAWTEDCECRGKLMDPPNLTLLLKKAHSVETKAEARALAAKRALELSQEREASARNVLEMAQKEKKEAETLMRTAIKKKEELLLKIISRKRHVLDQEEKDLKSLTSAMVESPREYRSSPKSSKRAKAAKLKKDQQESENLDADMDSELKGLLGSDFEGSEISYY